MKPVDLSLNNGVTCSPRCLEVLHSYTTVTSLRLYSDRENMALRERIAASCGGNIRPSNVYLHNGSGPILKQVIPQTVRREIRSSPFRMLRHLISGRGYPLIAPFPTYEKVVQGAFDSGLKVRFVDLQPEQQFRLDPDALDRALAEGDGLVYLCNPNNPTGSVLLSESQLVPLIRKYPASTFYIDEAYVQYVPPAEHRYMAHLVAEFPNVVCSRTFSFAHGLAAAHLGYLVAPEATVQTFEKQVTAYRIPALVEDLGIAAIDDAVHLEQVRRDTESARHILTEGLRAYPSLEPFPSCTNFILVRVRSGPVTASMIAARMKERGVLIRAFEPVAGRDMSPWFRVTVGTPDENRTFLDTLLAVMR